MFWAAEQQHGVKLCCSFCNGHVVCVPYCPPYCTAWNVVTPYRTIPPNSTNCTYCTTLLWAGGGEGSGRTREELGEGAKV
eukprot:365081-Chlamydomonas_euryale.AAC.11